MARRSESHIMRLGAICLAVLFVAMAAAFNLQKFPGFRGTSYTAEFTDASGLRKGNIVQVAGIHVGRVNDVTIKSNKVLVHFDVHDAELGRSTRASVQVLNLLGEKYLDIVPAGSGEMKGGSTIPVSRTDAGYDIVGTLGTLTTKTEAINTEQLGQALSTMAGTLQQAAPEVRSSFRGLSRISQTIASRDEELNTLLKRAGNVTELLDQRKGDLVKLMKEGDLVFKELIARRDAIHSLLVNARTLATELEGLAKDNQAQIAPALAELGKTTKFLTDREKLLRRTIHNLGPYASILINIIGTGPWFDAYVPNFAGLVAGEFKVGKRPTS